MEKWKQGSGKWDGYGWHRDRHKQDWQLILGRNGFFPFKVVSLSGAEWGELAVS